MPEVCKSTELESAVDVAWKYLKNSHQSNRVPDLSLVDLDILVRLEYGLMVVGERISTEHILGYDCTWYSMCKRLMIAVAEEMTHRIMLGR
jgi:hypothetical protein